MSEKSAEFRLPQGVTPILKTITDNFKVRLSEDSLGINPRDVVRVIQTPEGGKMTFLYKQDFIARTVGHLLAIPAVHLPLLTFKDIFKNPSRELVDQLYEHWKDVPWKGDIVVRLGHTSVVDDIIRLFSLDRKKWVGGDLKTFKAFPSDVRRWTGREWKVYLKTLWSLGARSTFFLWKLPFDYIMPKLFRTDYYDMFTKTVNIFHPNIAVGMHEMGHAHFFDQYQKDPKKGAFYSVGRTYVPFVKSFVEWKASVGAFRHMKTDEERRKATKVLEGAWGGYLVNDIAKVVAPHLQGPIKWAFSSAGAISGMIAGHLLARLPYPGKRERFGYVFEGKKDPVYYASARAPA